MEKPVQKELNTLESQQKFTEKIQKILQKRIPNLKCLINTTYIEKWDPIKEYFSYFLRKLESILGLILASQSESPLVEISELSVGIQTLEIDILSHLNRMADDFEKHEKFDLAKEIKSYLKEEKVHLKFLNRKTGVLYFENLESYVFEGCQNIFLRIKKPRLLYEYLMVFAKKMEAFLLLFFKSMLISYFDIFSKSQFVDKDWEMMKPYRKIHVYFILFRFYKIICL